jgi:peptidoglycan-associated lipoprotein
MIQTRRGRGGSAAEAISWRRAALVALAVATLVLSGCSSEKKGGGVGQGQGQQGMNEGGVGGTGSGSLAQFQKGTLGAGGPLSDIHFDYDEYTVREQDGEILKTNADWLQKNAGAKVQIEGHCDDRGSEEYNLALGAKRAQAAKDYLQTLGVPADRMSTISYGKELPLCTEETDDCWAQNRRAHFVVNQ